MESPYTLISHTLGDDNEYREGIAILPVSVFFDNDNIPLYRVPTQIESFEEQIELIS